MPLVYVIVLNWNGWRDTAHYVASLKASNYPNLHSVVVDNGSTDGSPQLIAPLLEAPWGELVMATHAPPRTRPLAVARLMGRLLAAEGA